MSLQTDYILAREVAIATEKVKWYGNYMHYTPQPVTAELYGYKLAVLVRDFGFDWNVLFGGVIVATGCALTEDAAKIDAITAMVRHQIKNR